MFNTLYLKQNPIKTLTALTLILVLFGTWRFLTHTDDPLDVMVEVKKATIEDIAHASGAIVPRQIISIKSQIPGIVAKILRDEGEYIAKGEKLIDIRPEPTPKQFVEARQELDTKILAQENKDKAYQRVRKIWEKKLVSDKEYDEAQEAFEQSKLATNLSQDKLNLLQTGKTEALNGDSIENIINSPSDGFVLKRHVSEGDSVVPVTDMQPGTELLTMADMNDLVFKGIVDEIDIGRIKAGMPAQISLGALPDKTITGTIASIGLQASNFDEKLLLEGKAAPEMKFKVVIDKLIAKEIDILRSGYSANAKINVRVAKDVLTLPERVIEWKDDKPFVMLWNPKTKKFSEQSIKIGLSDGLNAEILEGLKEGAKVKDSMASKIPATKK